MPNLILLALLLTTGCGAAYGTQYREFQTAPPPKEPPPTSLVPSDSTSISDAEIHRILGAKPTVRSHVRIALFHLSHKSMEGYPAARPDDMIILTPRFVSTIQQSPMVVDASYLPGFLVSSTPTLGQLRETAARYQADLVLLFSTNCRLYPQYSLFSSNEARAYCSADSALLDVRTGLVPFVARSGEDVVVKQTGGDGNMSETVRRAEVDGIDRAMQLNTQLLVRFLENARRPDDSASEAVPDSQ